MRRAIADALERGPESAWRAAMEPAAVFDEARFKAGCETVRPRLTAQEQKVLSACRTHGERVFFVFEHLAEPIAQVITMLLPFRREMMRHLELHDRGLRRHEPRDARRPPRAAPAPCSAPEIQAAAGCAHNCDESS